MYFFFCWSISFCKSCREEGKKIDSSINRITRPFFSEKRLNHSVNTSWIIVGSYFNNNSSFFENSNIEQISTNNPFFFFVPSNPFFWINFCTYWILKKFEWNIDCHARSFEDDFIKTFFLSRLLRMWKPIFNVWFFVRNWKQCFPTGTQQHSFFYQKQHLINSSSLNISTKSKSIKSVLFQNKTQPKPTLFFKTNPWNQHSFNKFNQTNTVSK